ncbi:MAG: NAD(P)-dependent alcohol dehydrogenase [Hahellaceae bacterium]|nr:NAD(P)-dependent alcohol dehydrogenase [Hahellaceae bacterium]
MHAICTRTYGEPDVLSLSDYPTPALAPGEYLVKVEASSVNPVDWKVRRGEVRFFSGLHTPPPILGADFSGTIAACGPGTRDFKPGDEVFGMVRAFKGGAYAEYVKVTSQNIARKPRNLSFEEAAAFPLVGLTVYQGLVEKTTLTKGQQVLVNGCCGGVGHIAVQMAKLLGAEVTGVCSAENADLARRLGAAHVIDYRNSDITAEKGRYDIFFDAVNNQSFRSARSTLTPKGIYMTTMPAFDNIVIAPMLNHLRAQQHLSLWVKPNRKALEAMTPWIESGKLRPHVSHRFPMEAIAEAHQLSESGKVAGKIVLQGVNAATG